MGLRVAFFKYTFSISIFPYDVIDPLSEFCYSCIDTRPPLPPTLASPRDHAFQVPLPPSVFTNQRSPRVPHTSVPEFTVSVIPKHCAMKIYLILVPLKLRFIKHKKHLEVLQKTSQQNLSENAAKQISKIILQ